MDHSIQSVEFSNSMITIDDVFLNLPAVTNSVTNLLLIPSFHLIMNHISAAALQNLALARNARSSTVSPSVSAGSILQV